MHAMIKMKANLFPVCLGVLLITSLLINFQQHNELQKLRLEPASWEMDAPFVQAASAYWIKKLTAEGGPSDMDGRYARVIYFDRRVCVSLVIKFGVGGNPVYCFDEKSKQLTEKYDDVE